MVIFKNAKKITLISGYHQFPIIRFKKLIYLFKNDKFFVVKKIIEFLKSFFLDKIFFSLARKSNIFFIDNKKIYQTIEKKNKNVYKYDNEDYSKYLQLKNKKNKKKLHITFLDMNVATIRPQDIYLSQITQSRRLKK